MTRLAETAFAKINLALHVREKMADGYHRIETIFAFCEDGDGLGAEMADDLALAISGPFGAGLDASDDIVLMAAEALRHANGYSAGASLTLDKRLPIAAGLGGGSADAAAALRLLNRLWALDRPPERLQSLARGLGADVPACVRSETMRGTGRGDVLEPVELGLSGTPLLLVNPRVGLPTAEVFAGWDGHDRGPLRDWRHGRNDLEQAARALVPQIGAILAWLSVQPGAEVVRMSGSGATCFAVFASEADRDRSAMAVPREWWHLATRLR